MSLICRPNRSLLRVFVRIALAASLLCVVWGPQGVAASSNVLEPDPGFGERGVVTHSAALMASETEILFSQIDGMQRTVNLIQVDRGKTYLARHNSDGTVDSSFGSNGRTPYDNAMFTSEFQILSNGKIVEVGLTSSGQIVLQRRLANGQIDNTFGKNGQVLAPSFEIAGGISGTPRLVVDKTNNQNNMFVGSQTGSRFFYNSEEVILSFTAEGILNLNFGYRGISYLSPVQSSQSCFTQLADMAVQSDGQLLVLINGCDSNINGYAHTWVYRLNPNSGNLDSTFGNGGVTRISNTAVSEFKMERMTVAVDGSILLFGFTGTYYWGPWSVASAKLQSDGTLETSYGTAGLTITSVSSDSITPRITNPVLLSNGNIVLGATVNHHPQSAGVHKNYLLQFTSSGALDTSTFNSSGELVIGVSQGQTGIVQRLLFRSDGSYVLGFARKINMYQSELIHVLADGTVDTAFQTNNSTSFVIRELQSTLGDGAAARQPDGKIVVATSVSNERTNTHVQVMRLLPNGQKDPTFGDQGTSTIFPGDIYVEAQRVVLGSNGEIYIITARGVGDTYYRQLTVFRLTASGTIDTSYGTNGMATNDVSAFRLHVNMAEILSNGQLIISSSTDCDLHFTRFLVDGSLDTTFDGSSGTGDGDVVFGGFCADSALRVGNAYYVGGSIDQAYMAAILKVDLNGIAVPSFGVEGIRSFPESDGGSGFREGNIYQVIALPNGNIVGIGDSILNADRDTALFAVMPNGEIDTEFDGAAGPGNGIVYYRPVNGAPLISGVIGTGDSGGILLFDVTREGTEHRAHIRRITNSGLIDETYGINKENVITLPTFDEVLVESIQVTSDGKLFGIGQQDDADNAPIFVFQMSAFVAPITTVPVTTAPIVSPTPTTTPVAPAVAPSVIAVGKTTKQSTLLKALKLTIPVGGKLQVISKTTTICKMAGTSVRGLKTGTCSLSITTTSKKGVKKTVTKKIPVTKASG